MNHAIQVTNPSNCIKPFKPVLTNVIFIHYKSRIAAAIRLVVDEDELK